MTRDELVQNGFAALALVEDETIKAFFVSAERAAIERAIANPHDAEEALIEVKVIRGMKISLDVAAQKARTEKGKGK